MATIRKSRERSNPKPVRKNKRKNQRANKTNDKKRTLQHPNKKAFIPAFKKKMTRGQVNSLVEPVDVSNYSTIAKGLKIKIGPGAPSLMKQLEDKIKPKGIRESLEKSRQHIDSLYLTGFDTEGLYAELIAWVQNEIVEQLPF